MENAYNKYFRELLEYTVGEIRSNGYLWYKEEFETKLLKAEKSKGVDRLILSQVWMIAGDIWDINGVPLCAADCYRKALYWNKSNTDALYELSNVYVKVGVYNKAIGYIREAITLANKRREYLDFYQEVIASKNAKETPYYSADDMCWLYTEKMAEGCFNEVLLAIGESKAVELLQIKAQCYGALKNDRAYIETWKTIYDSGECIELKWSDWFYMPKKTVESATIWELLIQMNARIVGHSVFEIYDLGYTDYEPSTPQMRELACLYRIYRAKKSVGGLKSLLKTFPHWTIVQNELSFLNIIDDGFSSSDD